MRKGLFNLIFVSLVWGGDVQEAINNSLDTLNSLHSKNTLNQRFARPLTGSSEFTTLDNSKTFRANLQCPSQERAVVITFIPVGSGEWRISIAGDLDLDGSFDHWFDTNSLGIRVSGVCTNGIVYCSPYYRWDLEHCSYYYWTISNGFISLRETQNRDIVGACVCTNYSCNGGNLPPYRWIVGAVSNTLMNAYPQLTLSKGRWDLSTFTYTLYGQDTRRCSGIEGEVRDPGGTPLTAYASSHIYPSVDLTDIALEQGDDPNSPYNVLMSASQASYNGYQIGVPNIYSCWIKKDVYLGKLITVNALGEEITPICSSWEEITRGRYWCYKTPSDRYCGKKVDDNPRSYVKFSVSAGDDANCEVDINGQAIYSYHIGGGSDGSDSCSYDGDTYANGTIVYSLHLEAYDDGACYSPGSITYAVWVRKTYQFRFVEQNNCHPDSDCRIKNEWICPPNVNLPSHPSIGQLRQYCIQTINEGTRLHPQLQPMCKSISTSVDDYEICMDGNQVIVRNSDGQIEYSRSGDYMWFKIYREYNCGMHEMNIDLTRINQTRDSATNNGQNIRYTDYVGGTGRQEIYINLGKLNNCPIPSCVVRYPHQQADVFSDGSNRAQINDNRYEVDIMECRRNSVGAWYCPVPAGGVILEPCSCTRGYAGFNIAIPTLQAVEQASHDIICSSN